MLVPPNLRDPLRNTAYGDDNSLNSRTNKKGNKKKKKKKPVKKRKFYSEYEIKVRTVLHKNCVTN